MSAQRLSSRELSWLAFNRRVFEEAIDPANPLIERARFLAIVTSNLDEFAMVRLAELRRDRGLPERDPAGLTPAEAFDLVTAEINSLVAQQYVCWREQLEPALRDEGLELVSPEAWTAADRESLAAFFVGRLEPVLTPLAVDPGRPFPLLQSGAIHVAALLESAEGPDEDGPLKAVVTVPAMQRLIGLPNGQGRFAYIEDVVLAHLDGLFPGYRVLERMAFRVIRDGSIDIDEDQATDLLAEIEAELQHRAHGRPVRIEILESATSAVRAWLLEVLDAEPSDVVAVPGPIDLNVLMTLGDRLPRPELLFPPFQARPGPEAWAANAFAVLGERDVLLHHPFDAFLPVVQLAEQAAADPKVLAIKQTLYRVSGDSPIVAALMRAARAGKQVTVLVELKARFDEERNIRWARRLEEAGAHVVYGLLGLKVHCKLLMIVRRDQDGIRRYCHIGTGNYNDRTARLYTDFSWFTANESVARDVAGLFNMLTGFSQPPEWERLWVAPLTMRRDLVAYIREQTLRAQAGKPAWIATKCNSLVDAGIADELYAASAAGVRIRLIVRGMCTVRAGIPGLSESISVRSVVGRFLEHSRLYAFAGDGQPTVLIGSADWMTRNLDRRVECLIRIIEPAAVKQLMALFERYWQDGAAARELGADGTYRRRLGGEKVQEQLLAQHRRRTESDESPPGGTIFTPLRAPATPG